jgi:Ankyrin repeats (3 copies)
MNFYQSETGRSLKDIQSVRIIYSVNSEMRGFSSMLQLKPTSCFTSGLARPTSQKAGIRFGNNVVDELCPPVDTQGDFDAYKAVIQADDLSGLDQLISEKRNINAPNRWHVFPLEEAVGRVSNQFLGKMLDAGVEYMQHHYSCIGRPLETVAEKALWLTLHRKNLQNYFFLLKEIKQRTSPKTYEEILDGQLRTIASIDPVVSPKINSECVTQQQIFAITKFLLIEGADLNAKSGVWHSTPLIDASARNPELALYLLTLEGINVKATNDKLSTAMHVAAANGHTEVVRALAKMGADIEARDKDGKTPLFEALLNKRYDTAKVMVKELGADIDAVQTPSNFHPPMTMLTYFSKWLPDLERFNYVLSLGANPLFGDMLRTNPMLIENPKSFLAIGNNISRQQLEGYRAVGNKTTHQQLEECLHDMRERQKAKPQAVTTVAEPQSDGDSLEKLFGTLEKAGNALTSGNKDEVVEAGQSLKALLKIPEPTEEQVTKGIALMEEMIATLKLLEEYGTPLNRSRLN